MIASMLSIMLATLSGPVTHAQAPTPRVLQDSTRAPVTIADGGDRWTLDNGIVRLVILKRNGEPTSIVYHGIEMLTKGHYWEQQPSGTITARITIDPTTNGGERAEVAVRGINADRSGSTNAIDIETRYTIERHSSGFYTYAQYSHPAHYPAAQITESRFNLENLNPTFDWMSVDDDRNMLMSQAPETLRVHAPEQNIYRSGIYRNSVEHKYSYSSQLYNLSAWGWSSTKDHVGVYAINPSNEYMGGGPERLDLTAHLSAPGSVIYRGNILDCWVSGHYAGGDSVVLAAGQPWQKIIGPIFFYFNALDRPEQADSASIARLAATSGSGQPAVPQAWYDNATALWKDAVLQARATKAAWPFAWVKGLNFPTKAERATVSGQITLDDPQATSTVLRNLNVGLTHADYRVSATAVQQRAGNGDVITWPHDSTYYQFWTEGSRDGRFVIGNVPPRNLHASRLRGRSIG